MQNLAKKNTRNYSGFGGSTTTTPFDVNEDPTVKSLKLRLDSKNDRSAILDKSISDLRNYTDGYSARMQQHDINVGGNHNDPNYIRANQAEDIAQANANSALLSNTQERAQLVKDLDSLNKQYLDAKNAAIDANSKAIDAQIKLLAEKAKTDPEALKQITALNEQKNANDLALAKQKSASSNIKIYVIVGGIVLLLAAIAGIWIWLKSRRAV